VRRKPFGQFPEFVTSDDSERFLVEETFFEEVVEVFDDFYSEKDLTGFERKEEFQSGPIPGILMIKHL
jgi:hypothetical protein